MTDNSIFDSRVKIGIVGLGIMGVPIVKRMLARGLSVTVWNLEPERFDLVRDDGAVWAQSPREVWAASDLAFLCVLGDSATESCCFGEDGFAKAKRGARVMVDLSTTSPEATERLATRLKSETGADWIDAPMSGGPQAALDGQLTLMVGGPQPVFQAVDPILAMLATNITHMGALGAGQKTKILNQAIVGTNYVLMAELIAIASAVGIDANQLSACLKGGMADSTILQRVLPQMATKDFDPPRGYARQLNKDLIAVSGFLENLNLELPVLESAIRQFRSYAEAGNEMEDSASVSRLYER